MNRIPSTSAAAIPDICPICHDDLYHPECQEFAGRHVVIAKPCGHKFHLNCLDPWTAGHLECPYGRKPIEDVVVEILTLPAGWQDRMVDAAKAGDTGTIRSLLNRGAEVNAGQPAGRTPLAWAATKKNLDVARLLADRGSEDSVGMNRLGWLYDHGQGVEQDYVEAVKWYRKAAELDHAPAQNNLGFMYEDGLGIEQNHVEAMKWYRKAAEQGHMSAQHAIGHMYNYGKGVEQNRVEAVKWYRKAAEQGHINAMVSLGGMYENGQGVEQDYVEAVKWYRKAVEQGIDVKFKVDDRIDKLLSNLALE